MNIIYHREAAHVLDRIDKATKRRIMQAIAQLPNGDIKPLKGARGYFRLRVGDWRILFSYPDSKTIFIVDIGSRGDIYKGVYFMTTKQKDLVRLVRLLPEREAEIVLTLIGYLLPDDIATPRDLKIIAEADEALSRGEFVRHEDINWD
jgi:mRNA interferase RelE/StbE